jgi:hypothetical protein
LKLVVPLGPFRGLSSRCNLGICVVAGQGEGPPLGWQYLYGDSWLIFVGENGGINVLLLLLALRQAWCLKCSGCSKCGGQARKRSCGCFDFRSLCLTLLSVALCGEPWHVGLESLAKLVFFSCHRFSPHRNVLPGSGFVLHVSRLLP